MQYLRTTQKMLQPGSRRIEISLISKVRIILSAKLYDAKMQIIKNYTQTVCVFVKADPFIFEPVNSDIIFIFHQQHE